MDDFDPNAIEPAAGDDTEGEHEFPEQDVEVDIEKSPLENTNEVEDEISL